MSIIVAGIHTGIGKTICSAIICQALGFDYWKPVQAGDLENSDSVFIQKNVTNKSTIIHEEAYSLQTAASPHYAASIDGIKIEQEKIILPKSTNHILVETAGGVMSPLSESFLNIDLIEKLNLPVVLVSNNYLGNINHTLLSVFALKERNINISGIVFSGVTNLPSEKFIVEYTKLPILFSIPFLEKINATSIDEFAQQMNIKL